MIPVLYLHNTGQISGGERSLLALWSRLDRTRFMPFLVVPQTGGLTEAAQALGVETSIVEVPSINPLNWQQLIFARRKLEEIIIRAQIALVHSYTPRNNLLAWWAGRSRQLPVIWHERNLIYGNEWDVSATFIRLPNAVIANSQAVARRFQHRGRIPEKVSVIYNGVDVDAFSPRPTEEAKASEGWAGRKVVGLVSNLNPRKNVPLFIEMAAIVSKEIPESLFVISGGEFGTANGPALRKLAADKGLSDKLIFKGFQSDVRPVVSAFDVFCAVTPREACSRALIEAMALGKPCVALRDGGNTEIVVDQSTGMLVPDDANAFAAAVVSILRDPRRALSMSVRGRSRAVECFDLKMNAEKTQELYLKVVGGKGQS